MAREPGPSHEAHFHGMGLLGVIWEYYLFSDIHNL